MESKEKAEKTAESAKAWIESVGQIILWGFFFIPIILGRPVVRAVQNYRQARRAVIVKQQREKQGILEWLATRIFMFDMWGPTLRDRNVRTLHRWLALGLLIIVMINFYIWTKAFTNMFGSVWLAIPMALGVSLMIGVLERTIVVADLRYRPVRAWILMALRIVVAIGLAMVSSKPLQQGLYHKDIMAEIQGEEMKLRAGLIERGRKATETDYAKRIKLLENGRDRAIGSVQTSQSSALSATSTSIKDRIVELDKKIRRIQRIASAEAAGQSGVIEGWVLSGKRGWDSRTNMALRESDKWRQESQKLTKQLADEARKSSGSSATLMASEHAKANSEITRLNKEKATIIDGFKTLSRKQLADKFGGQWVVSNGFLKQDEVLMRMATEKKSVWWGIFATTLFMILLDLLMLVVKLASGENLANYNSLLAQAKAGNEDALDKLRADGWTDEQIKEQMRPKEVRKAEALCRDRQLAVMIERDQLTAKVAELCKPVRVWPRFLAWIPYFFKRFSLNRQRRLSELNSATDAQFDINVMPALVALHNAESSVERKGGKIPSWPTQDTSRDEAHQRPTYSEANYRSWGWVNPDLPTSTPLQRRDLDRELNTSRIWWTQVSVTGTYEELLNLAQERDDDGEPLSIELIRGRMEEYWNLIVRPAREGVATIESRYDVGDSNQDGNAVIPPWPVHLNNGQEPPRELPEISVDQLTRLGWQDPEEQKIAEEMARQEAEHEAWQLEQDLSFQQLLEDQKEEERLEAEQNRLRRVRAEEQQFFLENMELEIASEAEEEEKARQEAEAEKLALQKAKEAKQLQEEQAQLLQAAEYAEYCNLAQELLTERRDVEEIIANQMTASLRALVAKDPVIRYKDLKTAWEVKKIWRSRLLDRVRILQDLESQFGVKRWRVPNWDNTTFFSQNTGFSLSLGWLRNAWVLPPGKILRQQYGWIGPQPTPEPTSEEHRLRLERDLLLDSMRLTSLSAVSPIPVTSMGERIEKLLASKIKGQTPPIKRGSWSKPSFEAGKVTGPQRN